MRALDRIVGELDRSGVRLRPPRSVRGEPAQQLGGA
jgi:hypothetical protein